jgi:hypothetical protein
MSERLQVGDQLACSLGSCHWIVRSVIPGRLRLVLDGWANPLDLTAMIQRLISEHPNIARVRLNQLAGSLLLEHVHGTPWRRSQVQKLLDQASREAVLVPSSVSPGQSHRHQGPLPRLQGACLLLLGHWLLADVWFLLLALVLVPILLVPLFLGLRNTRSNGLDCQRMRWIWSGLAADSAAGMGRGGPRSWRLTMPARSFKAESISPPVLAKASAWSCLLGRISGVS